MKMEEYTCTVNQDRTPKTIELQQWKSLPLKTGHKKRWSSLREKLRKRCINIKSPKLAKREKHQGVITDLHKAAESGDVISLKRLISRGENVNKLSGSKQGYTPPLLCAAANGHAACVKTLLAVGANVDGCDEWDNTALLKAASFHHTHCVSILLEHEADVNKANKWGVSPLQYAALQGYHNIARLLTQYGASISEMSSSVLPPPLVGAATQCHIKVLDCLLEQPYSDNDLESALTLSLYHFLCACAEYTEQSAAVADRYQCVELLVHHGAVVSYEHLRMCCYHYFIPVLNLNHYVRMLTYLIKVCKPGPSYSKWNDTMMVVFGHVTSLGPYKWELLKLMCSVGFTPSKDLLDTLRFTLTDTEYQSLYDVTYKPRSLTDLSRQAIRQTATSSVQHSLQLLHIPKTVKDIVMCDNAYFSSV